MSTWEGANLRAFPGTRGLEEDLSERQTNGIWAETSGTFNSGPCEHESITAWANGVCSTSSSEQPPRGPKSEQLLPVTDGLSACEITACKVCEMYENWPSHKRKAKLPPSQIERRGGATRESNYCAVDAHRFLKFHRRVCFRVKKFNKSSRIIDAFIFRPYYAPLEGTSATCDHSY